jgi:hypothetical protein
MRKRAIWLAAATAAALVSSPAAATQWGSYHWANNGQGITLQIQHNFKNGADWQQWYGQAVADWGLTSKSNITLHDNGGYSGTSTKKCDPIGGQLLVCSDAYGQRGWLGVAQIWASGDHITQATTKLNDSYFGSGSPYNTDGYRDLVACQEIGHDFGLDHQDETFDNPNIGTCMDYTNNPDGPPANRQPNGCNDSTVCPTYDYNTLTSDAMYGPGHNDSGGSSGGGNCNPHKPGCTGAQTDAFTFREVGKSPSINAAPASSTSWGVATGYDHSGRPDTFLLDLGNGHTKLTHVFWAKGFHPTAADFHD